MGGRSTVHSHRNKLEDRNQLRGGESGQVVSQAEEIVSLMLARILPSRKDETRTEALRTQRFPQVLIRWRRFLSLTRHEALAHYLFRRRQTVLTSRDSSFGGLGLDRSARRVRLFYRAGCRTIADLSIRHRAYPLRPLSWRECARDGNR